MTDKAYKLITLGNSGSGKSTLLYRITYDSFADITSTIGVQMFVYHRVIDNQKLALNLWDTANQERFKMINKIYYKGANIAIIVYSSDSQESFNSIVDWLEDLSTNISRNIPIVLVCTKIDLERVVSKDSIEELMRKYHFDAFFEVSSKTGEGITDLLNKIFLLLPLVIGRNNSVYLSTHVEEKNSCKC